MRAGWNPRLAERLQRADPEARPIVEAVVTSAEDVRRRQEEWDRASATGDVLTLASGGLRLREVVSASYISQTTRNGWVEDLDPSGSMRVARLRWPTSRISPVTRIRTWLHPRINGGDDQEVAYWECRVYTLMRYRRREFGAGVFLSLAEAGRRRIEAGGNEGEVTFDFDSLTLGWPTPVDETGHNLYPNPVAYVTVVALRADGTPAGNVGWAIDTRRTSVTQGPGVTLEGWILTEAEGEFAGWWEDAAVPSAVPYIVVEHADYQEATATFSGADQIDLGRPPAAGETIEFVAQGESPGGSALTYEVLADNGITWVPVQDGQTVDELPGVSTRQTYAMRVHLTPNAEGDVTPTVRNLGVRAVRRWTLDGLADVQLTNSWGFDPRTLKGTVPTARITILRDGPEDHQDFATELVSDRPPADLEFRIWIGSARLPRSAWLFVDTFELEDYDPTPSAIHFDCVHPAARARVARLPIFDEGAFPPRREPLVYANESLADVYSDLIAGQIALPERYRGAGVYGPASGTLVGKTITDSEGKTELDAIAFLAGGVVVASQGQVRFRSVVETAEIAAVFPSEEIQVLGSTPGLRQAVPEFFISYDWAEEEGRFRAEVKAFRPEALESVRAGRLDAPASLDAEISRWIATDPHAEAIGERHVGWFGTGLILLHWRSTYAHPHLEPGDVVLVETRQFVARDPDTGRALRGVLWARAVVSEVRDVEGREFVAWVQSYGDLHASVATALVVGRPEITSATPSVDPQGRVYLHLAGRNVESVRVAAATDATPSRATVQAQTPRPYGGTIGPILTLQDGQTAYIALLGYTDEAGGGLETSALTTAEIPYTAPPEPDVQVIQPPKVEVVGDPNQTSPTQERLEFRWSAGAGGSGPYAIRWRTVVVGESGGDWGPGPGDGWLDTTAESRTEFIDKSPRGPATLHLEVRYQSHPEIVGRATHVVNAKIDGGLVIISTNPPDDNTPPPVGIGGLWLQI